MLLTSFTLLLVLQVLDLLTTLWFMHLGYPEGNPAVRWAIRTIGSAWLGITLFKIPAMTIIWFMVKDEEKRGTLFLVCNLCYIVIVLWNLIGILTHLGGI